MHRSGNRTALRRSGRSAGAATTKTTALITTLVTTVALTTAALLAGGTPAVAALGAPVAGSAEPGVTAVAEPGTFRGYAFDACTAPPQTTMDAWYANSAYRGVGVYIGGVNRACSQPYLTASWVAAQSARWAILPIYVGLQAPCTGYGNRLSYDAATAEQQGRAAAADAISDASALGLAAGSVLYDDMEGYDSGNSSCRVAVLRFLTGWTERLHASSYRSGVYSSAGSGIRDLSNVYGSSSYTRPDHIWFAWWNGVANTDAGGYVPDDQWTGHQRIHQYAGNVTETHGGRTLTIDRNYADVAAVSRTQYGGVALTSRGGAGLDLFVRGSGGAVYHRNWNGSVWRWADLGGVTIADPAAVATGSGRLDVFVLGTNYRLYVNTWLSGQPWSGWRQLSTVEFTSSPAVTKRYDGGIDIAIRGDGSRVFHGYYNLSTGAVTFRDLGGVVTSAPAIVASATGDRLTVFARGADGSLWTRMWSAYNPPDGWYSWADRGVQIFGRPAATSRGGYAVDVFYRDDADDSLVHWYSPDAARWESQYRSDLGGHIYAAPGAYADDGSRIDVFSRNNLADLVQRAWVSGGDWSPWIGHGAVP